MSSITFQSNSFGRDPMELAAASQARERRQEANRQPVKNSPLPEYPRRWESPEWSPARQRAEQLFTGMVDERTAPSAARQALEALFAV